MEIYAHIQLKTLVMKTLAQKVAIITGAAAGIGKATAELFAREGARLILSDINDKDGNALAEALKASGTEAVYVHADTGVAADHEKLVNAAIENFGRLDVAVNNAGIGGPIAPTAEYPLDGWEKVIGINLSGVFYGMRYQIPAMIKNGGGNVVNIASILGQVGTAGSVAYVAAKHGVVGMTKSAALDHAADGIRVNAVGPGYIHTPLLDNALDQETIQALGALHALNRLGKSEEVAEIILWLASDKSSFATGAYYPVDGGYLAR